MESLLSDKKIVEILAQIQKSKDDTKVLDLISDLSMVLLEKNYPYVPRLISQVKEINERVNGKGVVHVELKLFEGKVQEAVFHEVTRVKF